MNISSSSNVTEVIPTRDSFTKAVIKNVVVVVLSLIINYVNVGIIHTFCKHQIFHSNPRYILFFHLVVNDMIVLNIILTSFIISYVVYKIQVSLCCILIIGTFITIENTPLNLACMAVECYIAVCFPLRHVQICTVRRTLLMLGLIWATTTVSVLPDLFVTLATQPLDFYNKRVLCHRRNAFPNPHLAQKRSVTYALYLVIVWIIIAFTYFKILFTAKEASKDAKKARNTILLHGFQVLLCMTVYTEHLLKELLKQLSPHNVTDQLFALYILIQVLPRSISPIIYGIRDKTLRKYLKRQLCCYGGKH